MKCQWKINKNSTKIVANGRELRELWDVSAWTLSPTLVTTTTTCAVVMQTVTTPVDDSGEDATCQACTNNARVLVVAACILTTMPKTLPTSLNNLW